MDFGTVGELERNLADPSSVLQGDGLPYPTKYKDENWRKSQNYDPEAQFSDHGGVHSNCTVISHAAYLMTQPSVDETKYEPLSTYDLAQLFTNHYMGFQSLISASVNSVMCLSILLTLCARQEC